MCGIVGLYNLPPAEGAFPEMLESMAHRGPDATGQYRSRTDGASVLLGHKRLSIIDLSEAANQPFKKDGFVLAYNGEIYNYQALGEELKALGAQFSTKSDTEVVLEAWRHWGPESLSRLRGMFAFALYDEKTRRLVLARDPFGIKPLFFYRHNGGLAFSSELKSIRPCLRPYPEVDTTALVASLMYYWVPDSRCVYRGVEKLPPGCWVEISPNQPCRTHRYWQISDAFAEQPAQEIDAAALARTVEDSVAAHMVADVPVSTFLSGGLDSSLITVMAANMASDVECYTISFREEDRRLEAMPNDLEYAERIAQKHGLKLHTIEIAPDVTELLPRMVQMLDEPIGDAAAINAYLICKAAREAGTKVLLSGIGADEIFGGYRRHYACLLAGKYRRCPSAVRKGIGGLVDRLPVAGKNSGYRTIRWAKRFMSFADLPEEAAYRRSYTHYGRDEFEGLLSTDLMPAVDELFDEHAEIYDEGPAEDQINRMCATDLRLFLPGLNLAYTDRASMAASTEVRVPFVDKEVIAAGAAIPGQRKIAGRETKAILKEAAEGWLSSEIIYRPKMPFSAPLRAWIRRDLTEMVEDQLLRGRMVQSGMVNGRFLRRMIDDDRQGISDRSKEIWQLLTLESWMQQNGYSP
jgi:asparagine synthase (glutamine-hydrolysing)